jgi:hypothetical protein
METEKKGFSSFFKTVFCAPKKTIKGKWGLARKPPATSQ